MTSHLSFDTDFYRSTARLARIKRRDASFTPLSLSIPVAAPLLDISARRTVSSKAKDPKVTDSAAPAATEDSKLSGLVKPQARQPDDGSPSAAYNAYYRAAAFKRRLKKRGASDSDIAQAESARQSSRKLFHARLNDPFNAKWKETYEKKQREVNQRHREKKQAESLLVESLKDHSIVEAHRARNRAGCKWRRAASMASARPELLAKLEKVYAASKAHYKSSLKDPRNAKEVEALRTHWRMRHKLYNAANRKRVIDQVMSSYHSRRR